MRWSKVLLERVPDSPSTWVPHLFRSLTAKRVGNPQSSITGPLPQVSLLRPGFLNLLTVLLLSGNCSAQTPAPAPPPAPRFVVVLDAAHGGDDTGAHLSSGQLEKAANLTLNIRLRSLLAARGIQVVTTRESDTSVDLDQRAAIANHANPALCLSLHASATGNGVHLFASSLAPAQPARFTPWKTAQAAWVTRSLALAGDVNSALSHAGIDVTLGRIPLPGIESMTCPALAIELGPLRDSEKKTTAEPDSTDYQARVANAVAAAILAWRSDPNRTEARQP